MTHRKVEPVSAKRGFVQILFGTLIGQVATLFALPIISRFYSPAQYGSLSLITSIAALLAPVFILGMDQAVVRPKSEASAKRMFDAGLLGALAFTIVTSVILLAVRPITDFFPESAAFIVVMLPICVLVVGLSLLLNQVQVRSERYGSLGIRNTIQSLSITVIQLGCGFIGAAWIPNGLIIGYVVGTGIGVVILGWGSRSWFKKIHGSKVVSTLKKEWRYPVLFVPSTITAQFSQQMPLLFLSSLFGVHVAGQIGMGERLIAIPAAQMLIAGSSVFLGKFSSLARNSLSNLLPLFLKFSGVFSVIGLVSFAGFFFLGPTLIPLLLGSDWTEAANLLQPMAFACATRVLMNPLVGVFRVLDSARILSQFEVIRVVYLVALAAALWILHVEINPSVWIIYTSLAILDLALWGLAFYVVKTRGVERQSKTIVSQLNEEI